MKLKIAKEIVHANALEAGFSIISMKITIFP
jgi:hypothetical protein